MRAMGLPRQVDVVGVPAAPAHQARILLAVHRLADAELEMGQGRGVIHGSARPIVGCLIASPAA